MTDGLNTGGPIGYAFLNISMSEHENDCILDLDWEFPVGNGITTDINSGLLRPFKSIFTSGQPPGKTTFVLYEEDGSHYILGSLSRTKKHIIFFPGGNDLKMMHHGGNSVSTAMHIDHFTLDQSMRTWHVTLVEKNTDGTKIPTNRTLKINDELFLWFVIQSNSLADFEKMPKRLQTQLTQTKSEVKRRGKEINNAREGTVFHSCKVEDSLPPPHVINFEFFVSLNGKPKMGDVKIFWNKPSNFLSDNRAVFPNRVHDVKFPGFPEIISIRVSKFPGSHSVSWNFNSGHIFTNN